MLMNKQKIGFVIAITLLVSLISLIGMLGTLISEKRYQREGFAVIQLVDSIYKETGNLPQLLSEFESESGFGPFYERTTDSTFTISFCLGFDDYYMYDSQKHEWYYSP